MELYDSKNMPLSSDPKLKAIQEKIKNGESLNFMEKIAAGRDTAIKEFNGYQFKSNHVYRVINEEALKDYIEKGFIIGFGDNDEYQVYEENGQIYNNNKGVDWYLGGACLRYGNIIIECPADKEYFQPAYDNGTHLCNDPDVRHFKSSGSLKPVPTSMITRVIDTKQILEQNKEPFNKQSEIEKKEYELIKQKNQMLADQMKLQQESELTMKYTINGYANMILISIVVILFATLIGILIFIFS